MSTPGIMRFCRASARLAQAGGVESRAAQRLTLSPFNYRMRVLGIGA